MKLNNISVHSAAVGQWPLYLFGKKSQVDQCIKACSENSSFPGLKSRYVIGLLPVVIIFRLQYNDQMKRCNLFLILSFCLDLFVLSS